MPKLAFRITDSLGDRGSPSLGHRTQQNPREKSLTVSIQDYLKGIYELTDGGATTGTSALAARLGVSPASVTGMIQKLARSQPALVAYKKRRGVSLTPAGRRAALQVIRHHRLLETWLVQALGYSWDEVHAEAENLEHAVSEDLEKRISAALGNPARDPHGEPIPSEDLKLPVDASITLSKLRPGEQAILRRVRADDPAVLKQLRKLGLQIGTHLATMSVSDYDGVMTFRLPGRRSPVILGPAITTRIFVETIGGSGQHEIG